MTVDDSAGAKYLLQLGAGFGGLENTRTVATNAGTPKVVL